MSDKWSVGAIIILRLELTFLFFDLRVVSWKGSTINFAGGSKTLSEIWMTLTLYACFCRLYLPLESPTSGKNEYKMVIPEMMNCTRKQKKLLNKWRLKWENYWNIHAADNERIINFLNYLFVWNEFNIVFFRFISRNVFNYTCYWHGKMHDMFKLYNWGYNSCRHLQTLFLQCVSCAAICSFTIVLQNFMHENEILCMWDTVSDYFD